MAGANTTPPEYAELHCISNFTFLRGASSARELVETAKDRGYSALAITDECSMAGIVRAHEVAKAVDLHLIIGSEFRLDDGLHVVLLAPNKQAYEQICQLITAARRRAEKGAYKLSRADFTAGLDQCLALWVYEDTIKPDDAGFVAEHFPDRAWIAARNLLHGSDFEDWKAIGSIAADLQVPIVATGGVYFHISEQRRLHDIVTCIRHGCTIQKAGYRVEQNGLRHLRHRSKIAEWFRPSWINETIAIAQRCTFSLDELRYQYPREVVPPGETPQSHLRTLTESGIRRRWPSGVPSKVHAQIERELQLIAELGYEHYFLTVADIVRYARSKDILCQGRGSAANSAVCYALGVTEVDPARMEMLFERFISKERAEPPDIDIDFEHQRREEVIQYIYNRYGRERAGLAATVISYRPKSALRDVGKALGFEPEQVERVCRSIYWFDKAEDLALRFPECGLDVKQPMVAAWVELASKLLGAPRHLSQHVGGFVICDAPLYTLVPVENASMADRTVIQWDKDDIEALGLLKVDCLALGMLSAIRRALKMVSDGQQKPFELSDIPAEDPATYEMLSRGESTGVFQVESRAQMSMLPRLQPRNFYDLVIEVAIIRPGPIQGGMVHPYLRRRQGREAVSYPSPDLERVLRRTLGVPLFQEQVMQIAMVAAGFSPGEADQVRRSMAAWQRKGGLQHFKDKLINGMLARGYQPEFAQQIYEQILGFGSYGFPESHSASFALLVYASAWLKCHHPAAFCASLLNAQPMGFYAPAQLVADSRRSGTEVLPVDVAVSEWDCTLESPARLRLGMRMVAGMAEADAHTIIAARKRARFTSVDDLWARAKVNRRSLNVLTDAGALASLTGNRNQARWDARGAVRFEDILAETTLPRDVIDLPMPTEVDNMVADYRSVGLTLGRHPMAMLRSKLEGIRVTRSSDLSRMRNGTTVRVAGIVTHRQRPETASGVMFVSIEDETGISNLIVWPSVQDEQRRDVLASRLMVVQGELQNEEGVVHVVAKRVHDRSHWLSELDLASRDFH